MFSRRHLLVVTALIAGLSLTACATEPKDPVSRADFIATNDPLEPTNRAIFEFNDFLDRLLFAPLAGLYRVTVPPPLRDRLANVLGNMGEPVIFANNLLQGDFGRAGTTMGRFLTNSTLGAGGMFEVANGFGLRKQKTDFGATLHVWGAGSGPYIVLPFFGPSNVRDAVGMGVDMVISPWQYIAATSSTEVETTYSYSQMGATLLVRREAVIEAYDALREGSLDFYAQMRSVYRQHRAKELGEKRNMLPKFDEEDDYPRPVVIQ